MRRTLIAVLCLAGVGCGQGPTWQAFSPPDGRFTIQMPGKPKEQSQQIPTVAGNVKVNMFLVDLGNQGYFVAYNDLPAAILVDPQVHLDGAREGAIRNVNGKLLNEARITLDGFPGRDITFSGRDNTTGRCRIYLVKDRMYQVMVVATAGKGLPKDTDQYLDSFKLTK